MNLFLFILGTYYFPLQIEIAVDIAIKKNALLNLLNNYIKYKRQ